MRNKIKVKTDRSIYSKEKDFEILLYVCEFLSDIKSIFDAMAMATVEHYKRYGHLLNGSSYINTKYGYVQAETFGILKWIMGHGDANYDYMTKGNIKYCNDAHTLTPLRYPKEGYISDSDVECLDYAIAYVKYATPITNISFDDIINKYDVKYNPPKFNDITLIGE